jgi:hypothetical protein
VVATVVVKSAIGVGRASAAGSGASTDTFPVGFVLSSARKPFVSLAGTAPRERKLSVITPEGAGIRDRVRHAELVAVVEHVAVQRVCGDFFRVRAEQDSCYDITITCTILVDLRQYTPVYGTYPLQ